MLLPLETYCRPFLTIEPLTGWQIAPGPLNVGYAARLYRATLTVSVDAGSFVVDRFVGTWRVGDDSFNPLAVLATIDGQLDEVDDYDHRPIADHKRRLRRLFDAQTRHDQHGNTIRAVYDERLHAALETPDAEPVRQLAENLPEPFADVVRELPRALGPATLVRVKGYDMTISRFNVSGIFEAVKITRSASRNWRLRVYRIGLSGISDRRDLGYFDTPSEALFALPSAQR